MFNFSLIDFVLYELFVNKKIKPILQSKKKQNAREAIEEIMGVIQTIVDAYIASAGLKTDVEKLKQAHFEKQQEMQAFEEALRSRDMTSFFSRKRIPADDMSSAYIVEIQEYIAKFSTLLYETENAKLFLNISYAGFFSEMHNVLMHIYAYANRGDANQIDDLFDFHEYLHNLGLDITLAGRSELKKYLDYLQKYLETCCVPEKGDTHFKTTANEVLDELYKIRRLLFEDEKHAIEMECEKIRALQLFFVSKKKAFNPDVLDTVMKDFVQKNSEKIESGDFEKGWLYISSEGYLENYQGLLAELKNKVGYLKTILRNKPAFDAVIKEINDFLILEKSSSSFDVLSRVVSEGEFNAIVSDRCFAQNKSRSTSENAKWFFYGAGNPGVDHQYACKIVCLPGTLNLIEKLKVYDQVLLVKENEPSCIGVHEEVLAAFNLLISQVEMTGKNKKRAVVSFDASSGAVEKLRSPHDVPDVHLSYFRMN